MIVEPPAGGLHVTVTDRQTIPDFAGQMKYLYDLVCPEATAIRVVLDDLNTHAYGSAFAICPPEVAWRLARRLEVLLHAEARQLAELGGLRVERAGPSVP